MAKDKTLILRFMMIGSVNALITATIIYIMMEIMDIDYMTTNVVAYITAQTNNFFWSKYWVFRSSQRRFRSEIPLFLLAYGSAYITQFLSLLCMVEIFNMNEYLAQFIGLCIFGVINFVMNRRVTFKTA